MGTLTLMYIYTLCMYIVVCTCVVHINRRGFLPDMGTVGMASPYLSTSAVPGLEAQRSNKKKKVLTTAAAGWCGLWAVQVAHLAGVGHVVETSDPSKVEYLMLES